MKKVDVVFHSLETIINTTVFETVILIHSLWLCRTEEILPIEDVSRAKSYEPLPFILCTSSLWNGPARKRTGPPDHHTSLPFEFVRGTFETMWYKDVPCVYRLLRYHAFQSPCSWWRVPPQTQWKYPLMLAEERRRPRTEGSACTCFRRLSQEFPNLIHEVQCAPQHWRLYVSQKTPSSWKPPPSPVFRTAASRPRFNTAHSLSIRQESQNRSSEEGKSEEGASFSGLPGTVSPSHHHPKPNNWDQTPSFSRNEEWRRHLSGQNSTRQLKVIPITTTNVFRRQETIQQHVANQWWSHRRSNVALCPPWPDGHIRRWSDPPGPSAPPPPLRCLVDASYSKMTNWNPSATWVAERKTHVSLMWNLNAHKRSQREPALHLSRHLHMIESHRHGQINSSQTISSCISGQAAIDDRTRTLRSTKHNFQIRHPEIVERSTTRQKLSKWNISVNIRMAGSTTLHNFVFIHQQSRLHNAKGAEASFNVRTMNFSLGWCAGSCNHVHVFQKFVGLSPSLFRSRCSCVFQSWIDCSPMFSAVTLFCEQEVCVQQFVASVDHEWKSHESELTQIWRGSTTVRCNNSRIRRMTRWG